MISPDFSLHRRFRANLNLAIRRGLVAVVDVGSSKISCAILKKESRKTAQTGSAKGIYFSKHNWRVIGFSVTESYGVAGGRVVSSEAAENAIRNVLSKAIHMAGTTVDFVVAGYSGHVAMSKIYSGGTDLPGGVVTERDMARALSKCRLDEAGKDTFLLHAQPIYFMIDKQSTFENPLGVAGKSLVVHLNTISVDVEAVINLTNSLQNCGLNVAGFALSSYVSGLSTLVEHERDQGAVIVDIGSEITGISIFFKRNMLFSTTIGIGGFNITSDISSIFRIEHSQAEHTKIMRGGVIATQRDERKQYSVPWTANGRGATEVSIKRADLIEVIRTRIEELYEEIQKVLDLLGWDYENRYQIVFTGGCCEVAGFLDLAQRYFGARARIGVPVQITGMPQSMKGPKSSSVVGLCLLARVPPEEVWDYPLTYSEGSTEMLGSVRRTLHWITNNW